MKYVAILTALGVASAASLVFADDATAPQPSPKHSHHEMMEKLRAADTNGDGLISRQEAAALPMLAKNFDAIDTNHDGQLSKDELKAWFKAKREQMAAAWFKKLDTDGDGRISKAEAQAAPRLAANFDKIDTNGDGYITPDELAAAHEHHRHHRGEQQPQQPQ